MQIVSIVCFLEKNKKATVAILYFKISSAEIFT